MKERFLSFFVIGILTVVVFVFFFIRTQPVPVPKLATSASDSATLTAPVVTFVNPSKGATNPKLTLVEYSDFECPVCKQLNPVIDIALQTYPNDIRVVWKDMPNDSAHPHAMAAAVAAHCADRQGKFWEYAEALFNRQTYFSDTAFTQIAQELSLNEDKFSKCITSNDTLPIVQKDFQEGQALKIIATPALFVGDQLIIGLQTADELTSTIDKQLQLIKAHETSK